MKYPIILTAVFGLILGTLNAERPNFIVVIGDDISQEDFGCYGHPHIRTPHVDQLAKDGIRFDAAFLTASSCSPSRNSILSGRYPHNTGAQHLHLPLPADSITIPKLFQQAGYHTVSAGKYHSGEHIANHFDVIMRGGPSGSEKWIEVLQERPKDKPFFMWLASLDAHRGWSAQDIPQPHTHDEVVIPPYLLDNEASREDFAQYYNEISRLDSNLGLVRAELEKQEVADNTFILFMADNGRPMPRCKNTCYDSGLKTPFIVYYPPVTDANKGKATSSLVSAVDIAPTLMDLAGIDSSDTFQGKSFKPVLKNPKKSIRKEVFGEKNWHDYAGHERMVRTSEFLYIRNSFPELDLVPAADCWKGGYAEILELYKQDSLPEHFDWVGDHRPAEVLFKVSEDPDQLVNLSANPEYSDVLEKMQGKLDDWVEKTDDVVPDNPVSDFFDRQTGKSMYPGKKPSSHAASFMSADADDSLSHRKGTLRVRAEPGEWIEVEQQSHEFWFGTAISNKAFDGEMSRKEAAKYKKAFLENFNSAVTENALKWRNMELLRDQHNYKIVDGMLEWTEANDIPLRGHNIFWGVHQFVQPWVMKLNKKQLEAAVEERARDIGSRYKGRFAHYDLNNEMIHKNYYAEKLGGEITLRMANWVMAEDPDAKLYLNDYDILTGRLLDKFVQHIQDLLDMGVPLAGIGVQGHLHGDDFDPAALKNALDELAKFGLPIVITEFNFPGQRSRWHKEKGKHKVTKADAAHFAKSLEEYYRICFGHPAVEGILMWGFWAGANWIPESSMYDRNWKPTSLLEAYRNLVFDEWWTSTKVQVGASGKVDIPAFFGDYVIKSGGKTKKVKLSSDKGTASIKF
ncbi:MAG: sulfatase-like hydrolase/transferase [Puniceicoccaceae bacterium]